MKLFRINTILIGLIGALILVGCENSKTKGQTQTANTVQGQTAAIQGQTNATQTQAEATLTQEGLPVVLTEYADFQCPSCRAYYPVVKKLNHVFGDTLVVRYRYFPLRQHRYSRLAARAAQAAKNQGKFWAMHDMLFENQRHWASSRNAQKIFIGYAKKIGLDMEQFKQDLNSAETQRIVMSQKKEGEQRGVSATPTFFIDGEKVVTLPGSYKAFKALLDIYVNEAIQAQNSG